MADDAPTTTATTTNPARLLVGIVVGAIVVGRFGGPLSDWIGAVGTAAHESGHALVADLLTGRVVSITVFRAGGGVTYSTTSDSDWRTFLVSGAGYPATLVAGLILLTGVLVARSSRTIAIAGAVASAVALTFWTPFSSRIPGIPDADQRFTWFVYAALAVALAAAAAVPDRHDTARRVVLGVVAVGLLSDALRAGKDLVVIEGGRGLGGATATDADALAASSGIGSSNTWAWIIRLGLFAGFAAWGVAVLRHWARTAPPSGAEDP